MFYSFLISTKRSAYSLSGLFTVGFFLASAAGCLSIGGRTTQVVTSPEMETRIGSLESRIGALERTLGTSSPSIPLSSARPKDEPDFYLTTGAASRAAAGN